MRNFKSKAVTITAVILTFLPITTRVYADAVAPPAAPPPQGKVPSIYWSLSVILVIFVIGIIALIRISKKK